MRRGDRTTAHSDLIITETEILRHSVRASCRDTTRVIASTVTTEAVITETGPEPFLDRSSVEDTKLRTRQISPNLKMPRFRIAAFSFNHSLNDSRRCDVRSKAITHANAILTCVAR